MTPIEIEKIFRDEAGRALATLIRLVGDFDLAEDVLQEAFAVALERWPAENPPSNPRAWLVNVARNKAIDRVRRQIAFRGKQGELVHEMLHNAAASGEIADPALDDDMMRLIFTCCHPSFAAEVQVALTMRTVCGLTTAQVARAFLVTEEAIRLCRLLDALMPQRGEIKGLLALMLLHDARRASRQTAGGDIVLLEEQDRGLWDFLRIAEGLRLVEEALRMPGRPEAYAVQAAIAALHARAPSYQDTDWPQIAGLYEVLLRISPSPVIELNHAAAVSMVDGPARALDLIDTLEARGALDGYELMPAVRADLLRRLGRKEAAREAYLAATAATQLEPLRRLYARRLAELDEAK